MNTWRLILKEILYRKLAFTLGVLSVLVAAGCLVAEVTLLRAHDRRTEVVLAETERETRERVRQVERDTEARVRDVEARTARRLGERRAATEERMRQFERTTRERVAEMEKATKARMAELNDEIRKITLKFGFNIIILPKAQEPRQFDQAGYADRYMPESYATKLADSRIVTVRHLLPSLRQPIEWPEQRNRPITLVGVRGEVAMMHRVARQPIMQPVPKGAMLVGYSLHANLGIKVGDEVKLMGKTFKVAKCRPQTTLADGNTLWIDLGEAQELLDKKGLINEILALNCLCIGADVGKVREEIAAILPETRVLDFGEKLLLRAEARSAAAAAAKKQLEAAKAEAEAAIEAATAAAREELEAAAEAAESERQAAAAAAKDELEAARANAAATIEAEAANRERLRREKERLAALLVPLVALGCMVWVGFLAFANARERSSEVGVLRALGVRSRSIFLLFLGKAVVMGLLGAALGYFAGLGVGAAWGEGGAAWLEPGMLALVLLGAPMLCGLASWAPAMIAAQQDPAFVLREG
jgi:ABC-type lipoprotein release transport system permease subunit